MFENESRIQALRSMIIERDKGGRNKDLGVPWWRIMTSAEQPRSMDDITPPRLMDVNCEEPSNLFPFSPNHC